MATKARGIRGQKCPQCSKHGMWTKLSPFYTMVRWCKMCRFLEAVPVLCEDEDEA